MTEPVRALPRETARDDRSDTKRPSPRSSTLSEVRAAVAGRRPCTVRLVTRSKAVEAALKAVLGGDDDGVSLQVTQTDRLAGARLTDIAIVDLAGFDGAAAAGLSPVVVRLVPRENWFSLSAVERQPGRVFARAGDDDAAGLEAMAAGVAATLRRFRKRRGDGATAQGAGHGASRGAGAGGAGAAGARAQGRETSAAPASAPAARRSSRDAGEGAKQSESTRASNGGSAASRTPDGAPPRTPTRREAGASGARAPGGAAGIGGGDRAANDARDQRDVRGSASPAARSGTASTGTTAGRAASRSTGTAPATQSRAPERARSAPPARQDSGPRRASAASGGRRPSQGRRQLIVIASSTGGPQALMTVFRALPRPLGVPVLIVQHMPAAFTPMLAEHIRTATKWPCREATDNETAAPDEVRLAPGGYHMTVSPAGASPRLHLNQDPPVNFCRPAADVLFRSVAEHYGRQALCVILTGMGADGAEGANAIKNAGGVVFAQDEETSVVWGMPGAAVRAGAVGRVLPLKEIASAIALSTKGEG